MTADTKNEIFTGEKIWSIFLNQSNVIEKKMKEREKERNKTGERAKRAEPNSNRKSKETMEMIYLSVASKNINNPANLLWIFMVFSFREIGG